MLSTTTAPALTAYGANFADTEPPAEKRAISTPSNESSVVNSTVTSCPLYFNTFPAEREDDKRRTLSIGSVDCSNC